MFVVFVMMAILEKEILKLPIATHAPRAQSYALGVVIGMIVCTLLFCLVDIAGEAAKLSAKKRARQLDWLIKKRDRLRAALDGSLGQPLEISERK